MRYSHPHKDDFYSQKNFHYLLEQQRNAWKLSIIAFSSIISAIAVTCVVLVFLSSPQIYSSSPFHAHQRFSVSIDLGDLIQVVCKYALYPDVCVRELSSFEIPITSTPLDLASFAVHAAVSRVDEAHGLASQCSSKQNLNVVEGLCALDCIELMENTKDSLNAVISKLSTLNAQDLTSLRSGLKDVQVLLSSSLSYQTACSDGFEESPGYYQELIQSNQNYVSEVTANSLSLVNILSQVGNSVASWLGTLPPSPKIPHLRRLLTMDSSIDADGIAKEAFSSLSRAEDEEGFPEWISPGARKLLQAPTSSVSADMVVAQDGSGDYENITEALNNVPNNYVGRYVIYIKEGVYEEVFNLSKNLENITFLGDGIGYTVITGERNVSGGLYNTYRTSTVGISANGFLARDITFRNTAGASGHQAVAVRAAADLLVFDGCSFEGYQDTLYALSSRQFYRNCQISGTVDFIFGNAIAVFQNCKLIARQPLNQQQNTYTAHGRKVSVDISGYSFQNCTLTGDTSLMNSVYNVSTYLGRPWKAYSRVVFIQSQMDALVDVQGWLEWNSSNPFTDTLYYGEFENRGPGSNTSQRVNWTGVHPNMSRDDASQFTVSNFLGQSWLDAVQVGYDSGLSQ